VHGSPFLLAALDMDMDTELELELESAASLTNVGENVLAIKMNYQPIKHA
jgi:hypothetical protein